MKTSTFLFVMALLLLVSSKNGYPQSGGVVYQSGSAVPGNMVIWGTHNQILDGGPPVGTGTVLSITLSNPGGLFSVIGTNPITASGTFGYLTTGISGGIPYFSNSNTLN